MHNRFPSDLPSLAARSLLFALALSGAACSSSSESVTPTVDGAVDAVVDAPADTAAETSADTGAETAVDAPAAVTCASYCTTVQTACTGARAQYSTNSSCLGTCAAFAAGNPGDMSGNSLACRAYHATKAVADAATHCPHAGPSGGDDNPTDATAGVCGEACDAFCTVAMRICTGSSQAFADAAACMTACKGFKADAAVYSTADTSNNDYGCRLYHLSVAASDAASATTHCAHIGTASPVCTQ